LREPGVITALDSLEFADPVYCPYSGHEGRSGFTAETFRDALRCAERVPMVWCRRA